MLALYALQGANHMWHTHTLETCCPDGALSVPALQKRACLTATTMAQPLSEFGPGRHPTALTRLPFKEAPLWGRKKSHPMLCSCKTWCTRHWQQQGTVLPQLGVCLFANHQHNTSHVTGCVSLPSQCSATQTEETRWNMYEMEHAQWITNKISGICVLSAHMLKRRSLTLHFATPVLCH